MIKKQTVFSLVHEQSVFMTAIMSMLTFLAVMALGVALAIGTGVMRWNAQWDLFATVQVMNSNNADATKKIIDNASDKIESVHEISKSQMTDLMRPWISGGGALQNYLPQMYEIKFKSKSDMATVAEQIRPHARVLTHADAMRGATTAGWKMILIAALVLGMTLGVIGICISYIARNTAKLHRRELEILNQVGARDSFVAHQMQIITGKVCALSGLIGFVAAAIALLLILGAARGARIGLMAMMGLNGASWIILMLLPVAIVIFAIWIAKRTTLNILKNS